MKIIPVIDIRYGVAVQAVAGDRKNYRPVRSHLTDSASPIRILNALDREFRCEQVYVADLDAIEGRSLNRCTLAEMGRQGPALIIDAGIRTADDARAITELSGCQPVVASECLSDLRALPELLTALKPVNPIFSVDLRGGRLMLADGAVAVSEPVEFIAEILSYGIESLLILDLATVGTARGIVTLELCRQVKTRWPEVKVLSGGGVRSPKCLTDAKSAGLDGLLIASALHDGRLTRESIAAAVDVTD